MLLLVHRLRRRIADNVQRQLLEQPAMNTNTNTSPIIQRTAFKHITDENGGRQPVAARTVNSTTLYPSTHHVQPHVAVCAPAATIHTSTTTSSNFQVYADNDISLHDQGFPAALPVASSAPFVSSSSRQKENVGSISSWQQPLHSTSLPLTTSNHYMPNIQQPVVTEKIRSSIPIFVEQSCVEEAERERVSGIHRDCLCHTIFLTDDVCVCAVHQLQSSRLSNPRKRLEGLSMHQPDNVNKLLAEPLRHMKKTSNNDTQTNNSNISASNTQTQP